MKKGQYIKISKLKAAKNPLFETPDKEDYVPGQENGPVSLPVDYWAEGTLVDDIKIGVGLQLLRTVRNGVKVPGFMQTSLIKSINLKTNTITTDNSVYKIEIIK